MRAELVGLALAVTPGEAAYLPLDHRYPGRAAAARPGNGARAARAWLEGAASKVGHDSSTRRTCSRTTASRSAGSSRHDAGVLRVELDCDAARPRLGRREVPRRRRDQVRGHCRQRREANHVRSGRRPDRDAVRSRGRRLTLRLHPTLWPQLADTAELESFYVDIEQPLIGVLERMESAGVMVNAAHAPPAKPRARDIDGADRAGRVRRSGRRRSISARRSSYKKFCTTGCNCRCSERLRKASHRPPRTCSSSSRKTTICRGSCSSTARSRSSNARTRTSCRTRSIRARGASTLRTTKRSRRPAGCPPRIRICRTSRFAHNEGRRIRQAFVAAPGFKLLAADYSQIELRIMAHLSGDEGLLAAFAAERTFTVRRPRRCSARRSSS